MFFFEIDNLDLVESIVKEEGLDVDFWRGSRLEGRFRGRAGPTLLPMSAHRGVFTTEAGAKKNLETRQAFEEAKARTPFKDRECPWELLDEGEVKKVRSCIAISRFLTNPLSDTIQASRVTSATAVNRGPGASWHPHRGTTAFLRLALESKRSDCEFFSWTPVSSLSADEGGVWALDCGSRHTLRAREVVLATNAYTKYLFPEEMAAGKGLGAQ